MNVIKITRADLDKENYYKEDGIGHIDLYADTSVEIAEGLGWVRFRKGIYVNGSIVANAGTGIEAGAAIKAGTAIEAGWGIKAGEGIEAGWGIVSLYSSVKAALSMEFNANCAIAAGVFSVSGPQPIEAQKVGNGTIAYGVVKLLPQENGKKSALLAKADELIAKANELKDEAEKV